MPCEYETKTFKICRCGNKWRCDCLIPRERKPHPPFNVGLPLGVKKGLHPKFYTDARDSPAVGSYDPRSRSKSTGVSWKKEIETKEFSETMGGRMLQKYEIQRDLMKRGRGPGTHEVPQWPENALERPCKTVRKDVGFGTVPLFKPAVLSTTPGPGYTPGVHNPYHYLEEKRLKSPSCVPSFEFDGLQSRFRSTWKSWWLSCNRYNVKHPDSLETTLKKATGKRGPYDLFTGPRDASTIKGYLATGKLEDRGDWPKALPSEIGRLLHKSNYFKGRWTTCPRFPKKPVTRMMLRDIAMCYKDPNQPGPGHYNPKSPRKPKNALNHPFDSCIEHVRPRPRMEIRPGPGRYRIKEKNRIKGRGWTWVFKSKAPRTNFIIVQSYKSF